MIARPRRAGISVPLFSLRSSRSWGIGEIGDIPAAAAWLRSASQSVLQILPLNELAPGESSPYSALSAMAIDPQFISIWMLDAGPILEDLLHEEVEVVRQASRVDYKRVRNLKGRALRAAFDLFFKTEWRFDTGAAAAFRAYINNEAWWLDEYSLYRALRAEAGERPWTSWAAEFRDRDPSALRSAHERLGQDILFYQYVQWIASDQLKASRLAAESVEILGDFPFMVTLDSADVWSRQSDFILDASVGTPPDAFSETGQEWGLPPYRWDEVQKTDFEWLRMRARRLSALYDGFRVDHLVGFYRTYVRPRDGGAPYFLPAFEPAQRALGEAIVRIMIETGSDVSVEDLGTVPDFVRESIAHLGVPGYKVLRWEPGEPAMYPALSVAMTGTHDTASLAEWWESLSADERARFGNPAPVFDAAVLDWVLGRIYASGSNLVLLPIQDVFGWRDRINQPATISENNWTFVLPWPVDRMGLDAVTRERAARLGEWIDQTGRGGPPRGAKA